MLPVYTSTNHLLSCVSHRVIPLMSSLLRPLTLNLDLNRCRLETPELATLHIPHSWMHHRKCGTIWRPSHHSTWPVISNILQMLHAAETCYEGLCRLCCLHNTKGLISDKNPISISSGQIIHNTAVISTPDQVFSYGLSAECLTVTKNNHEMNIDAIVFWKHAWSRSQVFAMNRQTESAVVAVVIISTNLLVCGHLQWLLSQAKQSPTKNVPSALWSYWSHAQ